jgi:flagellar basal-body rod modification protein FlgD
MTTVNAANATTGQANSARVGLAANFETFLNLLTAQLQNQDPLSPMDTKDFTNQLVQFTGVEQQLKTNDLLASLAQVSKVSAGATAVAYLGKTAKAETNLAGLGATGTTGWDYQLPRAAGDVTLRVLDERGRVIATAKGETSTGAKRFEWDGRDAAGRRMPPGTYRLQIDAKAPDGQVITGAISQSGPITGVDLSGAQPTVTLAGAQIALDAIRSIGLSND